MSLELVRLFGVANRYRLDSAPHRRFGVPPGGPFDRESHALANALLGLPPHAAVWELGMANATFRCTTSGTVAVVGAHAPITVDGVGMSSEASFPVHTGAELHIGPPPKGARVYVAYRPGTWGRRRLATVPAALSDGPLRVVAGPQSSSFDLTKFRATGFQVGHASDRIGVRLEGTLQPHDFEIPSEPACVGAIQVTPSGELVILGPEGPTIGGYPKIAVVIDADRDRLAQLCPGQPVGFSQVTFEEAAELSTARRDRIASIVAQLKVAAGTIR